MLSMWARIALRSAERSSWMLAVETRVVSAAKRAATRMNEKREKPRILRVIDITSECNVYSQHRAESLSVDDYRESSLSAPKHNPIGRLSANILASYPQITPITQIWSECGS